MKKILLVPLLSLLVLLSGCVSDLQGLKVSVIQNVYGASMTGMDSMYNLLNTFDVSDIQDYHYNVDDLENPVLSFNIKGLLYYDSHFTDEGVKSRIELYDSANNVNLLLDFLYVSTDKALDATKSTEEKSIELYKKSIEEVLKTGEYQKVEVSKNDDTGLETYFTVDMDREGKIIVELFISMEE